MEQSATLQKSNSIKIQELGYIMGWLVVAKTYKKNSEYFISYFMSN